MSKLAGSMATAVKDTTLGLSHVADLGSRVLGGTAKAFRDFATDT